MKLLEERGGYLFWDRIKGKVRFFWKRFILFIFENEVNINKLIMML